MCKIAHSEVDNLASLARAHELEDKVAVVCRFSPEGEAATLQLPSIGPGGQRQIRSWPALRLGGAGRLFKVFFTETEVPAEAIPS